MGSGVEAMKYRFQWNYPLLFSPHYPKLLYAGSNVLLASSVEGQNWTPSDDEAVVEAAKGFSKQLTAIEEEL